MDVDTVDINKRKDNTLDYIDFIIMSTLLIHSGSNYIVYHSLKSFGLHEN